MKSFIIYIYLLLPVCFSSNSTSKRIEEAPFSARAGESDSPETSANQIPPRRPAPIDAKTLQSLMELLGEPVDGPDDVKAFINGEKRPKRQPVAWSACDTRCAQTYTPVCDNWGTTQQNLCYFQQAACRATQVGTSLAISYYGTCSQPTSQYYPYSTTGSQYTAGQLYGAGITSPYGSASTSSGSVRDYQFSFQTNQCERQCPSNVNYVCDNEGRQYNNDCFFSIAACHAGNIGRTLSQVACTGGFLGTFSPTFAPYSSQIVYPQVLPYSAQPLLSQPYQDNRYVGDLRSTIGLGATPYQRDPFFPGPWSAWSSSQSVSAPGTVGTYGSFGSYGANDPCFRVCSSDYRPLCDNTGMTHNNECFFTMARCYGQRRGTDITIVANQACNVGSAMFQSVLASPYSSGYIVGTANPIISTTLRDSVLGVIPLSSGSVGQASLYQLGGCVSTAVTLPQCNIVGCARSGMVCGTDRQTYCSSCDLQITACQQFPSLATLCQLPCSSCYLAAGQKNSRQ